MSTGRPHHYGHLLLVWKESLQHLTLNTSFHDLINVYNCRSGSDNPKGQNFDVNRNLLSLRSFATSLKEISLKSDFIQFFFHDFIYVYSPCVGANNPLATKFWRQQKHLVTSVICYKFHKHLCDFMHFFMILYMYTAWVWGRQPPGDKVLMSTEMSCHFIHLLQVSKKCLCLWSLILYIIFFSWSNTCIKPQGWCRQPPRDKIWMSTERPDCFTHLLQFLKKSLWSLILYIFFHDLIHVYSPRAGADSPQGTEFGCQQKGLITLPICCNF